ncbi:hypothetical protein BP5796_10232 [Coleophoma crateriformis]|uniref:Inositol-pentakisphosphate 2-kinase n=1 Tax=Coleophoma crateriformis TaxID=565419 RepID=A0A3D8QV49_9HELO|nr:hypothetical protein BP5796_10232 [Coleophoma crateriformis]
MLAVDPPPIEDISGTHLPVLPEDMPWTYLDEGAANVVYRIHTRPVTRPGDASKVASRPADRALDQVVPLHLRPFEGKLLRLRKNLPTTIPADVSHRQWLQLIAPMFPPEHLVHQQLVHLKPSGIVKQMNEDLKRRDQASAINGPLKSKQPLRPAKRRGVYLADDNYGLLVSDMTSECRKQVVREFKPKWLLQSPSAPRDSVRCRTCATTAQRDAARQRAGEPVKSSPFCPLDLTSRDPAVLVRVAVQILEAGPNSQTAKQFAKWLQECNLMHHLRHMQESMDRKGVFEADPKDKNFLVAMTLRDCSIFMCVPDDENASIEARMGDLDLKSPDKIKYWRETEQALIDGGWYTGTEVAQDRQPNIVCALSPTRRAGV